MARPIVLLHGYSSSADSLHAWRDALAARGYETKDIRLVDYVSLSNEVTIRDIAEGERKPIYGLDGDTPHPFVFIGLKPYPFKSFVIGEHGYDGTVRWAGAALNTRKLTIDLTRSAEAADRAGEVREQPRASADIPLVLVDGLDHGTITKQPEQLVDMVVEALEVEDRAGFRRGARTIRR